MTYQFGQKSLEKLATVHPDLQRVFKEAITNSPYDFTITEGVRSLERQKELVAAKKSTTMNSRHLKGLAVDIAVFVDGKLSWDMKYYKAVADHIKAVAVLNDVPLIWGGDWITFKDGPHFELDRKTYP
jgi:peptidoglycan L-alanyl-D-glutamate endopeptidase CwlK